MIYQIQLQYNNQLLVQMNIIDKQQKKQEPSRDVQEMQLSNESNNCTEANSLRYKNKTIRLLPADDYFKTKITELQEEVNKLRCELSNVECNNIRERNGFINKIEIITMENAELKQHQNYLKDIINSLKQALKPKNQSEDYQNKRQQTLSDNLKHHLEQKNKLLKEQKKTIDELKKQLRFLQDQKNHIEESKDARIDELLRKNKQLIASQENRIHQVQRSLTKLPFNKQVLQAIFKALNLHVQADLSYDDLDFQPKLQESPVAMRTPVPDRRGSSRVNDTSYSRISSRSIINELNNNRAAASDYESDYYEQEQEEHYLCQQCKKIVANSQFFYHMKQCRQFYQLAIERQQLQKTISQIDYRQRESVSQRKWQNKKNDQSLRELDQNSRSPSKLTRRESNNPYSNQQDQMKKKISNFNKPQSNANNYRSTTFY